MSHTSPASFLVWSIFSVLLGAFLLYHLWSFDRFRCLRWNNGPYSGAFKRIMTYSYLLSIPMIMTFSLGFAVIKYSEGLIDVGGRIIPKPYTLWAPLSRDSVFPLTLMFSVGWSLEMVTHLEELCFWLFLVNAGSAHQDWFRSLYFKTWVFGSCVSVAYMPLITVFTRSDPLKSEAYTFLGGSLGSLSLTLWFTPVLWTFPSFLASLKREGVDVNTLIRLTKFHELNGIRICFRFLFVIPLVILGVDGVRPHNHLNESMFWTDFLTMLAAFGVCVSSGITLVIFFPRSVEGEIAAREASRDRKRSLQSGSAYGSQHHGTSRLSHGSQGALPTSNPAPITSSPVKQHYSLPNQDSHAFEVHTIDPLSPLSVKKRYTDDTFEDVVHISPISQTPSFRPNRRFGEDVELGGIDGGLTERNLSRHNQRYGRRKVNQVLRNFKSPIDLYETEPQMVQPRLTFRPPR